MLLCIYWAWLDSVIWVSSCGFNEMMAKSGVIWKLSCAGWRMWLHFGSGCRLARDMHLFLVGLPSPLPWSQHRLPTSMAVSDFPTCWLGDPSAMFTEGKGKGLRLQTYLAWASPVICWLQRPVHINCRVWWLIRRHLCKLAAMVTSLEVRIHVKGFEIRVHVYST